MSKFGPNERTRVPDDRYSKLLSKKLEDYPQGYARIAAFINSDRDTALFRRFGDLHGRVLLYRQAELTELQARLEKLDEEDARTQPWRNCYSTHHDNGKGNEARKTLVDEIEEKLKDYGSLMLQESQLRKLSRPSTRLFRNFYDYVYTENPFSHDEDPGFLSHQDDFVSLEEHEECWLDSVIYRCLDKLQSHFLGSLFISSRAQSKTTDPYIYYYSVGRVRILTSVLAGLIFTTLLLLPVCMFWWWTLSPYLMAFIAFCFVGMFSIVASTLTKPRKREALRLIFAYCIVLVALLIDRWTS